MKDKLHVTDLSLYFFDNGNAAQYHLGESLQDDWNSRLDTIEVEGDDVKLTYTEKEDKRNIRRIIRFHGIPYQARSL